MLDFIRRLFVWFDVAVYGVVESIFQVIVDLANIQLFNDTVIDQFASRLYIILGLVMLFKIMISFVQMLINPDKMDDKEQGVTSLLKRVVISLALIVLVPSIFDLARQVQTELLPVIPKVVLGVESDLTSEDSEAMNSVGRVMSFYTFLAFFNYDNQNCDDGSILGTGSRLDIEHQFQQPATIVSVGTAYTHVNDKCPASTDANGYRYKYNVLLSTIVGAYLLFVLVQIAVKIAIRTLKLGICEFVAPIPIASYIDPKMSKQTFDTWVNTCWKTYLDLFIRLIIVYFMIFVFQTVLTNDFLTALYGKLGGSIIRGSLVTVFIIVGVLQFAKEAPKFIGDMLGLKADGDLMGMFKDAWNMAGETGGYLKNITKAPISNWKEMSNTVYADGQPPSVFRKTMSAIGGVAGVTGNTIRNKLSGKSGKELTKLAFDTTTNRRNERIATKNRRIEGYSWGDERAEKWRRNMNISAVDDISEASYSTDKKLTDIMDKFGALGLKKGDEQKYNITTSLLDKNGNRGTLGAALGKDSISYSELDFISSKTEGDIFNGHKLTSSEIVDARERVLKQQKSNKTGFAADLVAARDSSAIQLRNELIEHFRSEPKYNDRSGVMSFADELFGNSQVITLNGITDDGRNISKSFKKDEFNRDSLIDIVTNYMNNSVVHSAIKAAGESSRGTSQLEAAAAARRNKARADAAKK